MLVLYCLLTKTAIYRLYTVHKYIYPSNAVYCDSNTLDVNAALQYIRI